MSKLLSVAAISLVVICATSCGGPLQYRQAYNVNQGEPAIRAFRIDDESVILQQDMSDLGWTAMLLERCDGGVRYTIEVDLYALERTCRGNGFFYDFGENLANFDLIANNRVLVITDQLRPFVDRWNEVLAECR